MKKCCVIYNPNSGSLKIKKYLPDIIKMLNEYKYEAVIYATKYKRHATEIVEGLDDDISLVMSFGGDGTFNEVMRGNVNRDKRIVLTHIPVGTTNDIGAMLGYSKKDVLENVRLSLKGVVKEFDIGLVNDRPFVYVLGIGKFTNLSYDTPRSTKKKIGKLAYVYEGVKSLFKKTKLYDITYEVNGEEYRGLFSLVLISNANHIAGIKNVYNDVKLDDNQFEIVFCNIKKKKDIIRSLQFFTTYDKNKVPGFSFYRASEIKLKINNHGNDNWCIDGERLHSDTNEYNVSILNGVEILVPRKNVKKLFRK